MRIAFITAGLEPGRDGVGDYTRRLAGELIRLGHACTLLGLNDGQIPGPWSGQQEMEGTPVSAQRLPRNMPWSDRVTRARRCLMEFKPDWVSLQFVPFGFQPKGICFGLGRKLGTVNPGAPWHVMFHELWLGLEARSPVKLRAWGALQRWMVRELVAHLNPALVHTQAEPYRKALKQLEIEAALLPLFGNIPFVEGQGWSGLLEPLVAKATGTSRQRNELHLAGVFGAVHPEWDAGDAVNTVLPLVQRHGKRLILVFCGKNNLTPEALARLRSGLGDRADIVVAGERTHLEISKILQTFDLGLATTPRQLIQKSGSVAAMLEHGLPVLVLRDDWQLRGTEVALNGSSRLLTPKQFASLEALPTRRFQSPSAHGVGRVVRQMLAAMDLPVKNPIPA